MVNGIIKINKESLRITINNKKQKQFYNIKYR